MLLFSGKQNYKKLAEQVYDWFCKQKAINQVQVTIYSCDLTEDNVFAWCEEEDENEFLISIHQNLTIQDYIVTLIHELIHVYQSICGIFDDDIREEEAYRLEYEFASQFVLETPVLQFN